MGKIKPNNATWEDIKPKTKVCIGTQEKEQTRLYILDFLGKKGIEKEMLLMAKGTGEKKRIFFLVGIKRKAEL